MSSTSNEYEVYWPRSPRQTQLKPLAKRLESFEGKTIVFVWDYVYRGDEVFALLEEGLKERYPSLCFVSWREFGNIHGTGPNERDVVGSFPQRFKELGVDAVIAGMAC